MTIRTAEEFAATYDEGICRYGVTGPVAGERRALQVGLVPAVLIGVVLILYVLLELERRR